LRQEKSRKPPAIRSAILNNPVVSRKFPRLWPHYPGREFFTHWSARNGNENAFFAVTPALAPFGDAGKTGFRAWGER
jgi:hypothetical protein